MKHPNVRLPFALAIGLLLAASAPAVTHYVAQGSASPVSPYTNWTSAAQTIQAALDVSGNGDLVLVSNGVYNTGGVTANGGALTNRIAVTNGIAVRSVNGPSVTAIVGAGPVGDAAVRCVYLCPSGSVSGFTVTNGFTRNTGGHDGAGGGVFCHPTEGAVVSNCLIAGCFTEDVGGGIYYGHIYNCVISNNIAVLGGGLGTPHRVVDCTIVNNRSIRDGAGIYGFGRIRNSFIACNAAGERGGGVYGALDMESCTIVGNSAEDGGGVSGGHAISNSIVYYNTDTVGNPNHYGPWMQFCCTTPDPGGLRNFTNNPGLAGVGNPHLTTNSPCINAGTNAEWMTAAGDIDGEARVGGVVDIGCDEAVPAGMTAAPFIYLNADSTNSVLGSPIRFSVNIRNPVRRYTWTFGDGVTLADQCIVSHTYAQTGTFAVTVTAWNAFGYVTTTKGVNIIDGFTNYVSGTGSGVSPYNSWATASRSNIQAAISACPNGGTVLVTNGIYETGGSVLFGSNRMTLARGITVRSVNGPTQTSVRGVWPAGAASVRGAYVAGGCRLEGFTLEDGRSRTDPVEAIGEVWGGGVWHEAGAVVSNCVIRDNGALNGGGAYGHGTLYNCTLATNSATSSGAGALKGTLKDCFLVGNYCNYGAGASQSTLERCVVQENYADEVGGGLYAGTARECRFEGNVANDYSSSGVGGGAYYSAIDNCLVLFNTARKDGGGLYYCTTRSSTVRGNEALTGTGGGVYEGDTRNSIVYYNYAYSAASGTNVYLSSGTCDYTCTIPDPGGTSNKTANPMFIAFDGFPPDLRLLSNSPCIDTGSSLGDITNDYEGVFRPLDGNSDGLAWQDMGAFEFASSNVDYDADGLTDGQEVYTYRTDPKVTDTDGDLQNDGDEVIAGVDPLSAFSFFQVFHVAPRSPAGYTLAWSSVVGRVYSVRFAPAVTGLWADVAAWTNLAGTGNPIVYTNTAPASQGYHAVRVRR